MLAGVSGIYRGLFSEYVKIAVQNGVYFGAYSMLKEQYGGPSKLRISTNLLLGVMAGAVTQLFANPLSVVQTREQTQESGKGGFWRTLLQIVSTEGASALYKGMVPALVLTTNPAIQFVVFDRLKAFWVDQKRRVQLKGSSSECKTDSSAQLSAIELLIIGAMSVLLSFDGKLSCKCKSSDQPPPVFQCEDNRHNRDVSIYICQGALAVGTQRRWTTRSL